ncbi:class I SAM-dependent methyltransferase [Microbulbifer sp. JMSA004]|uniref:class I SAM-dependent methyltransferase n=1 Tax=Microbulbifer sp. JMSA004 TaxID=3243370 RepID=UPI004039B710
MKKNVRHDNWCAAEYVKASKMQWHQAMEAIERCPFQKAKSILDVGCGDGRITRYIAENLEHGSVIGVDLTEDMIKHAREMHGDVPNLSFQQMSADELTFNKKFDMIFSFSCLHWVKNQAKVWEGFHKYLKDNGEVVSVVGFQAGHENFWDTVDDFQNSNEWKPYFTDFHDPYNHFSLQEMRNFIENAGFYLSRIDEIYKVEYFETKKNLTDFFLSWVPQFRHIPSPHREKFANQVIEEYLRKIHIKMKNRAGIRIKRYIIEVEK